MHANAKINSSVAVGAVNPTSLAGSLMATKTTNEGETRGQDRGRQREPESLLMAMTSRFRRTA